MGGFFALGNTGAGTLNGSIATLTGSFTIDTALPSYKTVTGLSVSVTTTVPNQVVLVGFTGASDPTSGNDVAFMGFTVDGGSLNKLSSTQTVASTYTNLQCDIAYTVSSAGSHTFQFVAGKSTNNWVIAFDAANAGAFWVIL